MNEPLDQPEIMVSHTTHMGARPVHPFGANVRGEHPDVALGDLVRYQPIRYAGPEVDAYPPGAIGRLVLMLGNGLCEVVWLQPHNGRAVAVLDTYDIEATIIQWPV